MATMKRIGRQLLCGGSIFNLEANLKIGFCEEVFRESQNYWATHSNEFKNVLTFPAGS